MAPKYDSTKLFIQTYNYGPWFENEKSTNKEKLTYKEEPVDLSDMPPLEGDEEVKEGNGLKIFTP